LVERCRKNPSYSLRAFARSLEIEPSALSKILKGHRKISKSMCQRLCERLGILATDFIEDGHKTGELNVQSYHAVDIDVFHLIADWYHYAILQLVHVKDFKADTKWVARTLDITVSEANIAIERLFRLQLLKKTADGRWLDSGSLTTLGHKFSVGSFRQLQRQILEKAIDALESVPMDERDQTSMTVAVDSQRLPEARERIKKFRRSLDKFLQGGTNSDRVYHLSISLYPVSHSKNLKKSKNSKNSSKETKND